MCRATNLLCGAIPGWKGNTFFEMFFVLKQNACFGTRRLSAAANAPPNAKLCFRGSAARTKRRLFGTRGKMQAPKGSSAKEDGLSNCGTRLNGCPCSCAYCRAIRRSDTRKKKSPFRTMGRSETINLQRARLCQRIRDSHLCCATGTGFRVLAPARKAGPDRQPHRMMGR